MKKVLCFVLSFVLFTLSFSFVSPYTVSADSPFDISLDSVLNYAKYCYKSYTDSLCKKITAARSFYFYYILTDYTCSGLPVFDDSGFKFSDEILDFYYEQYNGTKKSYITGSLGWGASNDIYNSDGDIFLQEAGFPGTRWSLSLCNFGVGLDDAHSSYPGSLDKPYFKQYYNTMLARYLISNGYDVTDPNPGKSGLDIAPGYVTSEDFKSSLSEDSSKYSVKNSAGKISYRTDNNYQIGLWNVSYSPTFFFNGEFVSVASSDGFYCVPFFTDGSTRYIGEYQMHFYFVTEYDYTEKTAVKYLCLDMWKLVDGSEDEPEITYKSTADFDDYKYFYLNPIYTPNPWCDFYGFNSLSDFYKNTNKTQLRLANIPSTYFNLFSPDFSQTLRFWDCFYSSTYNFKGTYETHDKSCSLENDDIGFITSSSPLSTTYNFDINKISDGQVVTVTGGDTIYNYTILNPETGDSSKFGDYITNNYTYITNNNGGEGSGGSGVGGSVTVGGQIDVGGSVGVDINLSVPDININVNGNGGAGGSGSSIANPDDFTSVENVDLTKYYDNAVEQSTGFQKFLKDFFEFLPPEIFSLLLFAIASAIVCRVFGR